MLSSGSARGRMRAGDTRCCCDDDDDDDDDDDVLKLFLFFSLFFFFNTLFLTEGAGVSRLIWLQVKCDVLAACCEISLTTTASTSSTTTGTTITDAPSRE